ncbi:hypothetical protein CDV31_013728 [Fusarium ambrosium]|uniref:Uncharacterized protein n=1 Tax=Fusarium ambrosium TaxID=131363 RepID=A0A428T1L3_9HYPO|nr:hypothetical protein CDV31_013728 [Fusarium ambrosium]
MAQPTSGTSTNMVTYRQLEREPASKDLFSNRITTIQGLYDVLQNSALLAIDTEHVAITSEKDRVLHQVGLAYFPAPSLVPAPAPTPQNSPTSPNADRPNLQDFYATKQLIGLTVNINIDQDNLVRAGGHRGMPVRRSHRFGLERQADLEDLEAIILQFIEGCDENKNLVMIGFGMAAEWIYLSTCFPRAMRLFSAWADLRDIAKDIAPLGHMPGLVSLLKIFRYNWHDLEPGRGDLGGGVADNAGDDAVATCALAGALLIQENQEKLRLRQECGRIAGIFTKKKGFRRPNTQEHPFIATISTQGPLPHSLNTGIKLARQFFNCSPQSTGLISEKIGYITFREKEELDQFIAAMNKCPLPGGGTLLVKDYAREHGRINPENWERDRRERQELRERRRSRRTTCEVEDLESLFS